MKAFKDMSSTAREANLENVDIHSIPFGEESLCTTCRAVFDFFLSAYKLKVPDQVSRALLVKLCTSLFTESVCQGVVDLNVPVFIEIQKRKPDLNSYQICGTIFEQYCVESPVVEWSLNIPGKNERTTQPNNSTSRRYRDANQAQDTIEIVHVTDTHVDLKYAAEAKSTGCREPICCRNYQGEPEAGDKAAGTWGSYPGCDIPMSSAEDTLTEAAANNKKYKYLYMTGDLIAHNLWETTQESNSKQIQDQGILFHEKFDGTKIFPVLGNHEPHPANVLAPLKINVPEYNGQWLYEVFYDSLCKDLPPEAKTTFMKGGFYSVSPEEGFRVIGLNTLFGYGFNWWMILDPVDPADQLAWLVEELLEAERKKEKVHILMHGPTSEPDTLHVWSREYHRVMERFQDTVAAQFVGHTHRDQFYLYYGQNTESDPYSVAWNGGSVTTYTDVNPNYKVYYVNHQNYMVEDIDTYIYNLTEANLNQGKSPDWFKLYSFKDAYDLPSLSYKDLDDLVTKLAVDDRYFRKYNLYFYKNSDVAYEQDCTGSCRQQQLCLIVSTANETECESILSN
ncbi:sphingomyelin phosphodiesterase-like [Macrosteles quadrilineatus]|uniref:sphingomyelin phosphodiesterase-like n=1 Tax=Macrosteles quadrilineatus TaxID=74068 RepID=UPI0023E3358A|nr:sphingomyelin phosphodiesterase-like [Macrosteles quadrilineatus]